MTGALDDVAFCHLVVGVSDMDRALEFYRLLGLEVVFDRPISGAAFDDALGSSMPQQGRVVGGLLGGLMVELLSTGRPAPDRPARTGPLGLQAVSLSVPDLDDAHRRLVEAGLSPDQEPFAIGGVRMFFVRDPDGTSVELIELPGGARSTYEMYRGERMHVGPVER